MSEANNENLYRFFQRCFPHDRTSTFVETPDGRCWSYAAMHEETGRIAACLYAQGARQGDRVAVQVEKSPHAVFVYLACLRGGYVYLPLNTAYPEPELAYFIGDARPSVLIGRPDDEPLLHALAERFAVASVLTLDASGTGTLAEAAARAAPTFDTVDSGGDDLAALLYTSGTTGKPKGAMLSHRNLASNAKTLHQAWSFGPNDVLLHALPLFHTHGLFVACHCVLVNGTSMILLPRFDENLVVKLLSRVTVFMGVPTFYTRLLRNASFTRAQCETMRLFVSGSAPLLEQTFVEFEQRTGHTILERYGMTECGMNTSNPLDGERRAGTVGLPLPGVTLRVVDEHGKPVAAGEVGAIEFSGPNVFSGYWQLPEKTAEEFTTDGYFCSGDLGVIDEDGYVSIVGRGKDLIITGGFNVYPKEVELCIDRVSGVAESAVIGLPHADFGEQVIAVIVPDASDAAPAEERIIAQLKTELASYKVPKGIRVIDALPRNAMGKVQKNLLRERFSVSNLR